MKASMSWLLYASSCAWTTCSGEDVSVTGLRVAGDGFSASITPGTGRRRTGRGVPADTRSGKDWSHPGEPENFMWDAKFPWFLWFPWVRSSPLDPRSPHSRSDLLGGSIGSVIRREAPKAVQAPRRKQGARGA